MLDRLSGGKAHAQRHSMVKRLQHTMSMHSVKSMSGTTPAVSSQPMKAGWRSFKDSFESRHEAHAHSTAGEVAAILGEELPEGARQGLDHVFDEVDLRSSMAWPPTASMHRLQSITEHVRQLAAVDMSPMLECMLWMSTMEEIYMYLYSALSGYRKRPPNTGL